MRLLVSGLLAVLLLATGMPAQAYTDTIVAPEPAPLEVGSTTVPAATTAAVAKAESADPDAADLVAQLPAKRTGDFGLVGVTWKPGFDAKGMTVQVRLRTADAWSGWRDLDIESDEGEGGRAGTEPLWVGTADGVAVRMTSPSGQKPANVKVATIDPGDDAATSTTNNAFYTGASSTEALQVSDGSPTYTSRPGIIKRSKWGASKSKACDTPRVGGSTKAVVVHHTAGTNSYSKSQSAKIVRATQAYHMKARDWCDIGYNFLVDKYGQIFEGRAGGVDRTVRGAHAGDRAINTYTMGVSMMGTFSKAEPSGKLKNSMVKLIGWRMGTTFMPATGTVDIGSYNHFNRISGHRNVVSTECPGKAAYAWLGRSGGLRQRVKKYVADYSSKIKSQYKSFGTAKTGAVYVGEVGSRTSRRARFTKLDMFWTSSLGTHYVSGYIRTEYRRLGAQKGPMGLPKNNLGTTSVSGVMRQQFVHGRMYRVVRGSSTAGYALWGSIALKYKDLGEAGGTLGAPTRSVTRLSDGSDRAYFDHGTITRQPSGDVVVVTQ